MPNWREPPVAQMRELPVRQEKGKSYVAFPPDLIDWLVQLAAQFSRVQSYYNVFPNGERAIVSNASKLLEEATTTATEIGYLSGVTSGIQGQLDAKVPKTTIAGIVDNSGGTAAGDIDAIPDPSDSPATADALRDDLVTNVLPKIRNAVSDLAALLDTVRLAIQP